MAVAILGFMILGYIVESSKDCKSKKLTTTATSATTVGVTVGVMPTMSITVTVTVTLQTLWKYWFQPARVACKLVREIIIRYGLGL